MSSQCAALHRPPLAPPSAVRRPPSRLHAVVAARGGPEAKSRCSGVLSPELRAGLAAAMLEDVLSALIRARTISAIWVVTPTPQLAELALRMGARCLRQPQPIDLNSAFAQALTAVAAFDPDAGVALLPGDLPLLTAADIDGAAALSLKSPALLAANRDGGTGLILLWNPGALTPDFGGASFARHSDQLRRSGQAVGDVEMAGFALDLDEPRDFAEVMRRAPGSHTAVFLRMALRGDAP